MKYVVKCLGITDKREADMSSMGTRTYYTSNALTGHFGAIVRAADALLRKLNPEIASSINVEVEVSTLHKALINERAERLGGQRVSDPDSSNYSINEESYNDDEMDGASNLSPETIEALLESSSEEPY